MRSLPVLLREFHECFEIPDGESNVRLRCVLEEVEELTEAIGIFRQLNGTTKLDPEGPVAQHLAKESVDVVYTIVSLFEALGWDFTGAFEEVHRSNMSKGTMVDGVFQFKKVGGKVAKPSTYSPADMKRFLNHG